MTIVVEETPLSGNPAGGAKSKAGTTMKLDENELSKEVLAEAIKCELSK